MFHYLSQRMIRFAVQNNIITSDDCELYEYSYETMFARIFSWLTIILIGFFFNCIFGVIVFFLTFTTIRIYAGGFHARGYMGCYLASIVAFSLIAAIYKVFSVTWAAPIELIGAVVAGIIIFCLSPIADPNKPLDERETKKYCENARLIVSVEMAAVVVTTQIPILSQVTFFMSAALVMEAILLLIPCSKKVAET